MANVLKIRSNIFLENEIYMAMHNLPDAVFNQGSPHRKAFYFSKKRLVVKFLSRICKQSVTAGRIIASV